MATDVRASEEQGAGVGEASAAERADGKEAQAKGGDAGASAAEGVDGKADETAPGGASAAERADGKEAQAKGGDAGASAAEGVDGNAHETAPGVREASTPDGKTIADGRGANERGSTSKASGERPPASRSPPRRVPPGQHCRPSESSLYDRLYEDHSRIKSILEKREQDEKERRLSEDMASLKKSKQGTEEEADEIFTRMSSQSPRASIAEEKATGFLPGDGVHSVCRYCMIKVKVAEESTHTCPQGTQDKMQLSFERLYKRGQEAIAQRKALAVKALSAELQKQHEQDVQNKWRTRVEERGQKPAALAKTAVAEACQRLFQDGALREESRREKVDARDKQEKKQLEEASVHRTRLDISGITAVADRLKAWDIERAERLQRERDVQLASIMSPTKVKSSPRTSADPDGRDRHRILFDEAWARSRRRMAEEAAAGVDEQDLLNGSCVSRYVSRRPKRPGEVDRIFDRLFTAESLGKRRNLRSPFRQQDAGIPATSAQMSSPALKSVRSMMNIAELTDSDLEYLQYTPCSSSGFRRTASPASTKPRSDTPSTEVSWNRSSRRRLRSARSGYFKDSPATEMSWTRSSERLAYVGSPESRGPAVPSSSSRAALNSPQRSSPRKTSPGWQSPGRFSPGLPSRVSPMQPTPGSTEKGAWREEVSALVTQTADGADLVFPRPVGRQMWARCAKDDPEEQVGYEILADGTILAAKGSCHYDEHLRCDIGIFLGPFRGDDDHVTDSELQGRWMPMRRARLGRDWHAGPGTRFHDAVCTISNYWRVEKARRLKRDQIVGRDMPDPNGRAALTIQRVWRGRRWARWVRECLAHEEEELRLQLESHERRRQILEAQEKLRSELMAQESADEEERAMRLEAAAIAIQRNFRRKKKLAEERRRRRRYAREVSPDVRRSSCDMGYTALMVPLKPLEHCAERIAKRAPTLEAYKEADDEVPPSNDRAKTKSRSRSKSKKRRARGTKGKTGTARSQTPGSKRATATKSGQPTKKKSPAGPRPRSPKTSAGPRPRSPKSPATKGST